MTQEERRQLDANELQSPTAIVRLKFGHYLQSLMPAQPP
jgi:hypothetical protein